MKIINLTIHPATPDQIQAGVVDVEGEALGGLKKLLTFDSLPSYQEISERAEIVAEMAATYDLTQSDDGGTEIYPTAAMIGGAPYLMGALETGLLARGVRPVYAFSERVSVEETLEDGSVRKTNLFNHKGFVEVSFDAKSKTGSPTIIHINQSF